MKFGRRYQITIETENGSYIVRPPFTIRFNIKRHVLSSLNTLDLDIFNLAPTKRDNIFQDMFYQALTKRRHITFEAGYDSLATIFKGTFWQANSAREGVDIITSINSRDGQWDVESTFTYRTLDKANLSARGVVQDLIGSYTPANLSAGTISNGMTMKETFQRPVALEGNTYDLLKKYSGGKVFIDLEKVYVLEDNEVIAGAIPLLSADTGLLSTPRRDESYLTVTTLFEPRIVMGQAINLISTVNPVYNAQYKVMGVQHQGIISDAVGGDCRTIIHLFNPAQFGGSIVSVS